MKYRAVKLSYEVEIEFHFVTMSLVGASRPGSFIPGKKSWVGFRAGLDV
jgi:hypothetical protein